MFHSLTQKEDYSSLDWVASLSPIPLNMEAS